jgi:hypothetical protein
MYSKLRIFATILFLASSLFACSDHRLRPLSPLRQRIKTIERVNVSTTTYTYDESNRVASYISSYGTRGLFYYDEQSRYSRYDMITIAKGEDKGRRYRFVYNTADLGFTVGDYDFDGARETRFQNNYFGVDGNKKVTSFSVEVNNPYEAQTYQYTGDNLTSGTFFLGRTRANRTFEFDDKPNPYYGLITPDDALYLAYSRNNVVKVTEDGVVIDYVYQYNEQGLPVQVSRKDGSVLTRFTYESY